MTTPSGNAFQTAANNGNATANAQRNGRNVGNGRWPDQLGPQRPAAGAGVPKGTTKTKVRNITVQFGGQGDGGNGGGAGGNGAGQAAAAAPSNHQGDGMIAAIERIEFSSEKDIIALAKAVNRLGRELHFILSMRAEEVQAVLSTFKGQWYTFGAASRVKARLVAMHLKVSAEAAKALGVGALKMAHAFDRHFVKPELEAKRKRNGQKARREFTITGEG
jgi:hypothetical protein